MTAKEQIKAIYTEIERLQETHERNLDKPMERGRKGYAHGVVACCDRILSFLDSLPEQPVEGLEEEISRYLREECSGDDEPSVSEIARHFAKWQKEQMMKEAVAVEVVGEKRDLRLIDSTQRCLFNAERGDWLRVIIVKE